MTEEQDGSMQMLCAVYRYPGWCSASGQRDPAGMEEVEEMEGKGGGEVEGGLQQRRGEELE